MPSTAVDEWLSALPHDTNAEIASRPRPSSEDGCGCHKRRRLNPPTPDSSTNDASMNEQADIPLRSSPQKRSIQTDGDRTPRGKRIQTPQSFEPAYSLLSEADSEASTNRSGASSPRKQLSVLEITDRGAIRVDELDDLDAIQYPPAAEFIDRLQEIARGIGVLSPAVSEDLQPHLQTREFNWARKQHYFSTDRDKLGRTPMASAVLRLVRNAQDCSRRGHAESVWNLEVHQKILEIALRPDDQSDLGHLVRFTGW